MTLRQIRDEQDLEQALAAERFLLFKHSTSCPISAHAFEEYRSWSEGAAVPTAWLDVRAQRPLSDRVAEATGVRHQSPQALLLSGGAARWNASHAAITKGALESAVG